MNILGKCECCNKHHHVKLWHGLAMGVELLCDHCAQMTFSRPYSADVLKNKPAVVVLPSSYYENVFSKEAP